MAETQPAQSIVTSAANQSSPYTHSLAPHCFFPELLEKSQGFVCPDAPVGMIIAMREGRILDVNQAFCEFLGYSPEELVGQTVLQLIHPEDVEATVLALRQRSTGTKAIDPLPKRYLHKNGELRLAEV